MADFRQADSVIDASLQHIIDNADRQIALSEDPVTYAGVAAVTLAEVAMDPADFSIQAGVVSGRRLVWARKTSITPAAIGTVSHMAFVDDTADEILLMWPVEIVGVDPGVPTDFAQAEHEVFVPEGA